MNLHTNLDLTYLLLFKASENANMMYSACM